MRFWRRNNELRLELNERWTARVTHGNGWPVGAQCYLKVILGFFTGGFSFKWASNSSKVAQPLR